MKKLVIITGPTAVGKTNISIKLAKAINGEIISADSIQVYKYMDIGSAKISPKEMDGIKHYLVDELEPDVDFNVYLFKQMATQAIEEIYNKGKIPIIVGGTGFYIQSVLYDINFSNEDGDILYRKELEMISKEQGPKVLHDMLRQVDPCSADEIHFNNVKRVIRALEFYKKTGKKISDHNKEQRENSSKYNFCYFVLNDDREKLYTRIDKRVDLMIDNGLVEEVKSLMDKGYNLNCNSMQGIGYKEIVSYLENKCSLEEAVNQIKLNTRHFAKRQLTWFKREKSVNMINIDALDYNQDKLLEKMLIELKKLHIIKDN